MFYLICDITRGYSPEIGTPKAMGMACEHWTNPQVRAKFRARTRSYVYIFSE